MAQHHQLQAALAEVVRQVQLHRRQDPLVLDRALRLLHHQLLKTQANKFNWTNITAASYERDRAAQGKDQEIIKKG